MTRRAYEQARARDKEHYKTLWQSLVKIIQANYPIKVQGDHELFIRIPKQEMADIEVFLRDDGFHVQLWYYELPNDMAIKHSSDIVKSATDAIDRIDALKEAVRITERRNKNDK